MKKIGVLTFHSAINNGAVLQAYALIQAIESFGIKCEDIDYTSKKIADSYIITSIKDRRSLKSIVLYFIQDRHILKTQSKFADFRSKYLNISDTCYDGCIEEASGKYDALIVGSDQVWNANLTDNDKNYYLAFDNTTPKFSYGASIGKKELNEWDINTIKAYLPSFKKVTVREIAASVILKDNTGIDSTVVPDPVYLLSKQQWKDKFQLKKSKENYILFFMLHQNEKMIRFCRDLSKKTGFKIYYLSNDFVRINGMRTTKEFGPEDFLRYIFGASYVVTDSFHAASMSLILNKELYIGLKSGELASLNTRIEGLVEKFGIADRIIGESVSYKEMDYEKINEKIKQQREFGLSVLREMVEW